MMETGDIYIGFNQFVYRVLQADDKLVFVSPLEDPLRTLVFDRGYFEKHMKLFRKAPSQKPTPEPQAEQVKSQQSGGNV